MRIRHNIVLLTLILTGCGAADSASPAPQVASTPTTSLAIPTPVVAASATPTVVPPTQVSAPRAIPAFTAEPIRASDPADIPAGETIAAPFPPSIQEIIDQASIDLGQRLGIAPNTISVSEVRSVTWPNAGLGCPQPGVNYKQVLVDGLYIALKVNGSSYGYHSGNGRGPFLCQ
jgi:hypothetical protein